MALPIGRVLSQLGSRSFGIYLLHELVMTVIAKIVYHVSPWLLALQLVFVPFVFIFGLGGPLLFMWVIANTPARKYYRHLFT
jgi:peptidoglycan/LPS O-acetylase OafA/YrhL